VNDQGANSEGYAGLSVHGVVGKPREHTEVIPASSG